MKFTKQTRKTSIAIVAAIALSGTAAVSLAKPDGDRFPINLAEAEERADARFAQIDTSADGLISLAEFEAAEMKPRDRKKFKSHRRQHADGKRGAKMGRAEGKFKNPERAARRAEHEEAVESELFAILDTNDDGALSDSEFAAKTREDKQLARKRASFKRFDTNADGQLSRDELPSMVERLRGADADGDGEVTRRELRAARQARMAG